ncbi:unnamed protein product [Fraxinus pennsylvanica]|uniref:Uncharacterized protein n=1 Tax=Fraxinus pennsylvanica TaxID=56036 RepID=A0AAD1ZUA1_9LAMI|nr:unnamed protein product [Fraxinus pennsylvanica]
MAGEEENGQDRCTQDGTVDLKGNPILRSKRGGWTACSFVFGSSKLPPPRAPPLPPLPPPTTTRKVFSSPDIPLLTVAFILCLMMAISTEWFQAVRFLRFGCVGVGGVDSVDVAVVLWLWWLVGRDAMVMETSVKWF